MNGIAPPKDWLKKKMAEKGIVKKDTIFAGVLNEAQALDLLAKASPRPWKLEITRVTPMRIDIFDANGVRVCHFHPVDPVNEKTPNWESDARFIIHLVEVINALKPKEGGSA